MEKGPNNGSAPRPAAVALRSSWLAPVEKMRLLEEQLVAIDVAHPRGDFGVWESNRAKLKKALVPLLVDGATARALTGGAAVCSKFCLNEDGDARYKNYKFVDTARFKLSDCIHHSHHVQCVITILLIQDWGLTACPI